MGDPSGETPAQPTPSAGDNPADGASATPVQDPATPSATPTTPPPDAPKLSDDRQYWWDGSTWQSTSASAPPTARRSDDGAYWWDGTAWRAVPAAAAAHVPQAPPSLPAVPGAWPQAGDPAAPFGRHPVSGLPYSDKSKLAAGLLQLFLGGFGAGRWYLGDTGMALGQLFTCGGCGVWALIDAIMMLSGNVRDKHGRPLRE